MDNATKAIADKIYKTGVKNGKILMKNKILKTLNRKWDLITDLQVVVKVMKIIDKIK